MVAAKNNLSIQITSSAAQTSAARAPRATKDVFTWPHQGLPGPVCAPQPRCQGPRAGGQFEAENDPGEGARGHPSLWQCRSLKRDRCRKDGQQRASDNHEDHGNG